MLETILNFMMNHYSKRHRFKISSMILGLFQVLLKKKQEKIIIENKLKEYSKFAVQLFLISLEEWYLYWTYFIYITKRDKLV